jgi:hypothetical protein
LSVPASPLRRSKAATIGRTRTRMLLVRSGHDLGPVAARDRDCCRTHAVTKAVPASHARASTNAGLDPRVATHLLVARSRFLRCGDIAAFAETELPSEGSATAPDLLPRAERRPRVRARARTHTQGYPVRQVRFHRVIRTPRLSRAGSCSASPPGTEDRDAERAGAGWSYCRRARRAVRAITGACRASV